jgi:CheY-like chemotaxis protein
VTSTKTIENYYAYAMLSETKAPNLGNKKVLVVDDNEDIRNLISIILNGERYNVLAVESGTEALEIYQEFKPELILLDIMMPGLSGFEVLEKIRDIRNSKLSSVPIVMITAKSLTDDIDRAIKLGATSYIVKPFRAESLKQKVIDTIASKG